LPRPTNSLIIECSPHRIKQKKRPTEVGRLLAVV
jgi:hypothetical protein